LCGLAWLDGYPYSEDDYTVYHGVQYKCLTDHTSSMETAPPHPSYWTTAWYIPPGYPLASYTQVGSGYDTNGLLTASVKTAGIEDFHADFAYSSFLRDGLYTASSSGTVTVPLDIQPWRIYVRPGVSNDQLVNLVTGIQKVCRGCAVGLLHAGNVPANGVTVRLTAPSDALDSDDPQPSVQYTATTNKLGWFVSPAMITRFPISAVGGEIAVSYPIRSRMYTRLAADYAITSLPGLAAVQSREDGRVYVADNRSAGIVLLCYDHADPEVRLTRPVTSAGSTAGLGIAWIAGRIPELAVYYVDSDGVERVSSTDQGRTWSEPVSIATGTYPQAAYSHMVEICCYINASNAVCVRRKLGTGTWSAEITVASGSAGDTADIVALSGERTHTWVVFHKTSTGEITRYKSADDGRTWAADE